MFHRDVPSAISPCGMCRQVLREFCPLQMPIFLVPAGHDPEDKVEEETSVLVTDMETLLPHSFGPEQLLEPRLA
jgi:cytidine deaminase